MNKSEQINELATALAKVQSEINDVQKDKEAGGRYKYADLSQVLETVRPVLSANGLSVAQLAVPSDPGTVAIETVLMHSSGQWISGTLSMPCGESRGMSPAQAVGSATSYNRRYSLAAIVGVSQTDDDGAAVGAQSSVKPTINADQHAELDQLARDSGADVPGLLKFLGVAALEQLPAHDFERAKKALEVKLKQRNEAAA